MRKLQVKKQFIPFLVFLCVFFSLVYVLLTFSCSGKPGQTADKKAQTNGDNPVSSSAAVAKELTKAEPESASQKTGQSKESAEPNQAQVPPAVKSTREQDVFSSRGVQTPLMPVDSILGPLGQSTDYDGDQRNAMEGAKEFLAAMQKGLSYSDKFMEGRRALLALLLQLNRDRGLWPKSARIGVPEILSQVQIAVPVLCEGKKGWAAGQLVMEKALDSWLVADVQLEWENLGEEGRARPVFDPSKGTYQR